MASLGRYVRAVLAVALAVVTATHAAVLSPLEPLDAPDGIELRRGVPLRYEPAFTGLRVAPPLEFLRRQKDGSQAQATITVNYLAAGATTPFGDTCEAWNAQAQAAFTFAANIWAALIQSPVTITVDACWAALDPGILGSAGPRFLFRDFTNAPIANTFYPVALANSRAGADLDAGNADIVATFSSAFDSSWYYGTDGNTPLGKIDFATVVLHEIGHGLGFTGSMDVSAGQGSWGLGTAPNVFPAIYDRFTENDAGTPLIETASFANPSAALATQLTSDAVFFDGTSANAANTGARVPLYAPPTWNDGSSYAHLAESFNGTPNALMTFSLSGNERIHDPGPVMLGMFRDMGWLLNAALSTDPALTVARAGSGSGTVASSPGGIDCGSTCSAQFVPDSTVTLIATAAGGSTFTGWTANAACSGTGTCTLTMSAAQGVTANFAVNTPDAVLSPTTLAFGNRLLGTSTPTLAATLQNTGNATLSVSGIAISGTNAGDFGQTNNCGSSVAVGASCTITVSFTPSAAGSRAATLSFSTNDPIEPTMQVALSGTGVLPTFALTVARMGAGTGTVTSSPAGIDCGSTCVFSFDSGTPVALSASPSSGSLFAGWGGACAGTGTCNVTMSAARNVTATFNLATPDAVLTPTTLTFGTRTLGTGTAQLTATLQNTGTAPLAVGSFAVTGTNAGDFSQGNDCGAGVAVGASCTITVSFTPTAAGSRVATLSFSTNDPLEPTLQVALSGSGVLPAFAVTVSKTGGGSGTVTSTPAGINCGATCSANFNSGASVALVAAPATGSFFKGWSGACTGTGACNVTMDAVKSVGAEFKLNTTIPRLANISTRMQVLTGNDVMIGGFIIGGSAPKTVVVRARGPSLVPFGIPNALANPRMDLYAGQTIIATNDNWQTQANPADVAAITASGFAPTNNLESAIRTTLAPGAYTAVVSGVGNGTGVGIVEVFEVDLPEIPLINISTRGQVLLVNDVMIGGFIIQGDAPQTVVIRARGPSLIPFGIPNALLDPVLQIFDGQTPIATNDNWQVQTVPADVAAIQGSGFAPTDAREAVIRITLPPGAYTAIVTGKNGTTGVGIVEVFAQ